MTSKCGVLRIVLLLEHIEASFALLSQMYELQERDFRFLGLGVLVV